MLSKRDRAYGQLITNFANAETSDEAGLKYIQNIKEALKFPDRIKSSKLNKYIPDED